MITPVKGYTDNEDWLRRAIAQHQSDECLLWPFKRDRDGYGRVWHEQKTVGAHRLAFKVTHGRWPIPCALHSCDNPPCFNPRHLFEGSDALNHADQVSKGRQTRGEKQRDAKLTENLVAQARIEYSTGHLGFNALSKQYGVSKIAMRWAIIGKTWKHVPGAVQTKRKHADRREFCKYGHRMDGDNIYIYGGRRQCKICTTERTRRRREKLANA